MARRKRDAGSADEGLPFDDGPENAGEDAVDDLTGEFAADDIVGQSVFDEEYTVETFAPPADGDDFAEELTGEITGVTGVVTETVVTETVVTETVVAAVATPTAPVAAPDAAPAPAPAGPTVRVLHGPNLNTLGSRDPQVYGTATLAEIEQLTAQRAAMLGITVEFFQSNHEGDLVEAVQAAGRQVQGIVINPGALTHYSRALADALETVDIPVIEVHLSNIHAREDWRATSVTAPHATAVVAGFNTMGYVFAVDAMAGFLAQLAVGR